MKSIGHCQTKINRVTARNLTYCLYLMLTAHPEVDEQEFYMT